MTLLLVDQAKEGDREAFSALVHERFGQLLGLARFVSGDLSRGEDALQDALIQAWRDLPSLREASKFDAWLRTLLINACRDQRRRLRRRAFASLTAASEPRIVDDRLQDVEHRDRLDRGMARLSPDQRAVLALRYYLDLPGADAAAVLGIPDATYRSRLRRALRELAAAISADDRATQAMNAARGES